MRLLLLMLLLQGQRVSTLILIIVVLAFVVGISLVVYFFRRFRRSDTDEEDWRASTSLFAGVSSQHLTSQSSDADLSVSESQVPAKAFEAMDSDEVVAGTEVVHKDETRTTVLGAIEEGPARYAEPEATQLLASAQAPAVAEPEVPLDEDIWAELEEPEAESVPEKRDSGEPAAAEAEELRPVRIESRPAREAFEIPRLERIRRREAFQSPSIEPIETPDDSAVQAEPPITRSGFSDRSASTASAAIQNGTAPLSAAEVHLESTRMRSAPLGSVLGLPAKAGHKPLVLGTPVHPANEIGIGGLAHYGKETGPDAGHGGTVALVAVIILLVGALVVYFEVPAVKSRVNNWLARVGGANQSQSTGPKAQIFPGRSGADKNTVKASGWVANISSDPLSDLSIEVVLQGSNSNSITVGIEPNEVLPQTQGRYQFEYDGKEYPAGYRITKLMSAGKEIPFARPAQGASGH